MVSLKLQNCAVLVLPADCPLSKKVQIKTKRRKIEWICPECNAKNYIKLKDLPYEFKGGDSWSQVARGTAYIRELDKLVKSRYDLMSFLAKKAELKAKYLIVTGRELQIKQIAATRMKVKCKKCGIKISFNVEISADSKLSSLFSVLSEKLIFESLEDEVLPEDNTQIIERMMRGYAIYTLMKNYHLIINEEKWLNDIDLQGEFKGNPRNFLEWIKNLENDMEKLVLFKEIERKTEEIMKNFKTEEVATYFSDIISFIRKIRRLVFRRIRRKLFLSLGWLEEQIELAVLKKS